MIVVDLSKRGFPALMKRLRSRRQTNPYTSRKEMQAALSRYMGGAGVTAGNKKTSGSSAHATGDNLKLAKSSHGRAVAYITTGLAITSANYLWRLFAGPDAPRMQRELKAQLDNQSKAPGERSRAAKDLPSYFGLTAADLQALAGDKKGVCPGATKGCMAVCLVDAGQQGTPGSKAAQIRRNLAFKFSRDALMATMAIEIVNLIKKVRTIRANGGRMWHDPQPAKVNKKGETVPAKAGYWETVGHAYPAVRLNINSDLDWENITFEADPWLVEMVQKVSDGTVRPGVQSLIDLFSKSECIFYDYTKRPDRFMRYATDPNWPSNYFLTFSLSESPIHRRVAMEYIAMVQRGERVRPAQIAVPFGFYDRSGKRYIRKPGQKGWQWPLPKTLTIVDEATGASVTAPVLDADPSDARFDDAQFAPGSIAGLRFKEILAKSSGGTLDSYSAQHVDPAVKLGFILKAHEGHPDVVIGIKSGGRQLEKTAAA